MFRSTSAGPAALTTFVITLALGVGLCLFFEPIWESNDDVGMAMVAGGYGFAAYDSPNILFSNVIWGELVRALPRFADVAGYSLASLLSLFAAAWCVFYSLVRLRGQYMVALLAIVLVFARPLLFPQFTIFAGLLTVASVLALLFYVRFGKPSALGCAVILGFLGFLVRAEEFILVLAVALPFLPWRMLTVSRPLQIALAVFAVLVVGATVIDRAAYATPEWEAFQAINAARFPLSDFAVAPLLLEQPELLAKYGYSENDILLVSNWFFADLALLDPPRLSGMLAELGPLALQSRSLAMGWSAEMALTNSQILALFLAAIALIAIRPRWSLLLALLTMVAALFLIGAVGRPGIMRVYYPVLSLLLLAPLAQPEAGVRCFAQAIVLVAAIVGCAVALLPQASKSRPSIEQVQKDVAMLPAETIYGWGAWFPYERAFPLLRIGRRDLHIYSLGVMTYAPYSFAVSEIAAGRGMIDRMATPTGILLLLGEGVPETLGTYCREHLNATMRASVYLRTASFWLWRVSCNAAAEPIDKQSIP